MAEPNPSIHASLRFKVGRFYDHSMENGKQERTLEIAKAMLADGMEVSKVAKLTNLSVKEVTALA